MKNDEITKKREKLQMHTEGPGIWRDPKTNPSTCHVDEELAKKWLATGAQPTEVVSKIFKQAGIEK